MKSKDSEDSANLENIANKDEPKSDKAVDIIVEKSAKSSISDTDSDTESSDIQSTDAVVAEFKKNDGTPVAISIEKKPADADEVVSEPYIEPISNIEAPVINTINEAHTMENKVPAVSNPEGNYEEWIVMPDSAWPPPIFIKKSAPPRERFYLEKRWHSQWSYYDSKATENKNVYFLYQRLVVIGALIIPALVSINSTLARFLAGVFNGGDESAEAMWRIGMDSITVMVSLMVAGAAALESLYKYGENWSSYRSAAEELQAEKNFYDMQSGPYANNANPFSTFVERVEGIVANQNGKYFQAVQQQLQKQGDENENIVASFKSGDEGDDFELSVQTTPSQPTDLG